MSNANQPAQLALRDALDSACKSARISIIQSGRLQVLQMPGDWVRAHILDLARETLNFDDYWEYRRFLELLAMVCPALIGDIVAQGLSSSNADVREAAEDFSSTEYVDATGREFIQSLVEQHPELRPSN